MDLTRNLRLPQYSEEDIFDLQDINKAYNDIDNAYEEIINFKEEIPKVNANAEIIEARDGEETLGAKIRKFNEQLDNTTKRLNKLYYNVSQFEKYVVNGDWTPAINKAIEVATANKGRVLIDGKFDIKSTIVIQDNAVLEGFGFTWGGVCGLNCIVSGIIAIEIQGVGITLKDFSVMCPSRYAVETHGIVLNDSAKWHSFNNYKNLRIVNFNGRGIKFDSIHDSVIENISVENCGNENFYAFEITSHNDTSNHCVFNRIQVEQSYFKAINIDERVMACNFINIHSERTKIKPNIITHNLTGYYNTYNNARIENATVEKNNIIIGGPHNTYENLVCDGTINHTYGVRADSILRNCNFDILRCENIIKACLYNCIINELHTHSEKIEVNNSNINTAFFYDSLNKKIFNNCFIETLILKSENIHELYLNNCDVNSNINVVGSHLHLLNCTLKDITSSYCSIFLQGCSLNNFTYDGVGNYKRILFNNYLMGDVTRIASGTITAINNYVLGKDFEKLEATDKICKPILI